MEIFQIDSSWDARLTGFLDQISERAPGVLAYHYPFYRDALIAEGMGELYAFVLTENAEIFGYLPGFLKKTPVGSVYNSMPYFGGNGGVLHACPPERPDPTEALLSGLNDWLACEEGLLSAVIHSAFLAETTPYREAWPDALISERFTQFLPITADEWPKKVRYDIRRCEKLGVTLSEAVTPGHLETFYAIYVDNCLQAGIPAKSFSFVGRMATEGVAAGHVHLAFAWHEEVMIGGLMTLEGGRTVSYYLPCSRPEARHLQPALLLIDHAYQAARSRGRRWWNWEASPGRDSGVYAFKKRWGSEEAPYLTLTRPYAGPDVFQQVGIDGLKQSFPSMYVYPFDRLTP